MIRRILMPLALVAFWVGAGPAGHAGHLQAQEPVPAALQNDTAFSQPPISPGGAFWRSLVVPGWAQAELGAKSRGAFYFFAESVSLMMLARTQIRLDHAERTLPEDAPLIEARKGQRQDWIAAAVFFAFAAAADGFVTAHLWGFSERTGDEPGAVSYGIGVSIPFSP